MTRFSETFAGPVKVTGNVDITGTYLVNGSPFGGSTSNWLWRGTWSSATAYAVNDVVYYSGSSYICTTANTNVAPSLLTNWATVALQGATGPTGPAGPTGPTGPSGSGTGDMLKSVYDTNADGVVDQAAAVPWTGVTGKPTFATVATSGLYSDLSGTPTLGTAAAKNVGTAAGTVAAGDDSRITGAAPLASPAFTGTPTAPTATAGTNTTQVATTAFVLANAGGSIPAYGAVNSTILAVYSVLGAAPIAAGGTTNGSNLQPGGIANDAGNVAYISTSSGTLTGIWRLMGTMAGYSGGSDDGKRLNLWLRVS